MNAWSVLAGFLSVVGSTRFHDERSIFFLIEQISLRAPQSLLLGQIRAWSLFIKRVMERMQRAICPQDDHVFFIV